MPGQRAKQWILHKSPDGECNPEETFKLEETDLPEPQEGEVLVELVYVSNDPAQRGWIDKYIPAERLYTTPIKEGEVVRTANCICRVVRAGPGGKLRAGQFVDTYAIGWRSHAILPENELRIVEPVDQYPLSVHIGALGTVALTAYFALTETLELKEGETIVISGAAGGVGSVAVQVAKHVLKAKRVIAFAGTAEKCAWVKKLGADVTICYKDHDWEQQLISATPDYVECYFDNVGGQMLTAMIGRMKLHGRIAAVGSISNYNNSKEWRKPEIGNAYQIISMRIKLQGMLILDYIPQFEEARQVLMKAYKDGHLQLEGSETVTRARFEEVPKVWASIFAGSNTGKSITQLVDI